MPRIEVLDSHVANLIAAGEVVDHPSSIVKELAENSIDAGATSIVIEVRGGGNRYIRVSDNGYGMSREDVRMCVRRHATSKVRTAGDIERIMTMGFRGEALAAISAVSRVKIFTKRAEDDVGTALECVSGEVVSVEDAGCPKGTFIVIEELFAKLPARRKFMKSDTSEGAACLAIAEKLALAHPALSVKFIGDNTEKLFTSGDGLLGNAIYSVYGRQTAQGLIPIKPYEIEGIKVTGYISRPESSRANRSGESFYVNGRFIRSRTMLAALEEAYISYIQPQRFPMCVIMLEINVQLVDVNIHPQKMEVKFSQEKSVYGAIYHAVRNALESIKENQEIEAPAPKYNPQVVAPFVSKTEQSQKYENVNLFDGTREEKRRETIRPAENKPTAVDFEQMKRQLDSMIETEVSAFPAITEMKVAASKPLPQVSKEAPRTESIDELPSFAGQSVVKEAAFSVDKSKLEEVPASIVEPCVEIAPPVARSASGERELRSYRIVGEAFNTYVMVEQGNSLLMIDKHAAHERILYEGLLRRGRENCAQMLLEPVAVSLGSVEVQTVLEYGEQIGEVGFEIEEFGSDAVLVRSVPSDFEGSDIAAVMEQFAQKLSLGASFEGARSAIFDKALYSVACKAAIKGGRHYAQGHIEWLVDRLMELDNILYCPHGRPCAVELTKPKLDRQFGRT